MICKNCDPKGNYLGRLVKATSDFMYCAECGERLAPELSVYKMVQHGTISNSWDNYFHRICLAVSSKSPCLSRHIGVVLVRDRSIVATGYNGPSRGIPHCGHDRVMKDDTLIAFAKHDLDTLHCLPLRWKNECPRRVLGYKSGTHMELCPAQHAEVNAISNAARLGVSVFGSTLYMNCIIPCKNCFGALINSGIIEIVVDNDTTYDKHTQFLIDNSNIRIRRFEL